MVTRIWQRFKTGDAIADAGSASAAGSSAPAQDVAEQPKAKSRSVASAPKTGFHIYSDDDESSAPRPEADMVKVYSRKADGTYSEDTAEESPPRPQEGMVTTRYNRKVGAGAVSRAAQTAVE